MSYIKHRVGDVVNGIKCIGLADRKCDRQQYCFQCPYCENTFITFMYNVSSGHAKSCGCEKDRKLIERLTKHGHCKGGTHTSEYGSYREMMDRCYNPKNDYYHCYGGRGIYVCERWKGSFPNFIEDMGLKPSRDYTIERVDNEGVYELSNCKWATDLEQSNNKRTSVRLTIGGITKTQAQWAAYLNIPVDRIRHKRRKGQSLEDLLLNA